MTPDQKHKLDEITEEITAYVNQIWVVKDFFDREFAKYFVGKIVIASPVLNFRDSMFHYQKMYEAASENNDKSFTEEYVCIIEHLNRGIKDFSIFLFFNLFVRIIHEMLNKNAVVMGNDIKHQLRNIYHKLKNIVAILRIEGQAIQRNTTRRMDDMIDEIDKLYALLRADNALKQLFERCTRTVIENTLKEAKIKV